MPWLPRSPRKRRRLVRLAIMVAVLVFVAIMLAFFRNTGTSTQTPLTDRPAQVYHVPERAPATPAERRAAERVLGVFVRSTVLRRDLADSWPLASPTMKEGTTHAEWLAGNLPVVPYPRAQFRTLSWRLVGSYRDLLDYDVLVLPKNPKGEQRVYACALRRIHGRWLVDSCYPRTSF